MSKTDNQVLFVYLRDSHASAGRIGLSIAAALGGISVPLGRQTGFALLADLRTGQIIWFNQLLIGSLTSDLRDPDSARSSIEALLRGCPA